MFVFSMLESVGLGVEDMDHDEKDRVDDEVLREQVNKTIQFLIYQF